MVSSALWRYADGQAWRPDSGLEVTCKNEGGPVECMWNDDVRFVGGDMNGDDRHETRQESASGCREKCDGTKGCDYWSLRRSGAGINCWLKREKQDEVGETSSISGYTSSVCIVTPAVPTRGTTRAPIVMKETPNKDKVSSIVDLTTKSPYTESSLLSVLRGSFSTTASSIRVPPIHVPPLLLGTTIGWLTTTTVL